MGVWTWVRDRRFPHLAEWFNAQVVAGRVLVCGLVILELASAGTHRAIPPAAVLIAAAAESAGVELVHYDHDYERIAGVTALQARWLVPNGTLA